MCSILSRCFKTISTRQRSERLPKVRCLEGVYSQQLGRDVDTHLPLRSPGPCEDIPQVFFSGNDIFSSRQLCLVVPVRLSAGAPGHTSPSPRAGGEKRAGRAVGRGETQTWPRGTRFLQTERSAWNGGWERKGETMQGKKRERHKTPRNSTAEWPHYSASSPGPENPVGRKLENSQPASRDLLPCADTILSTPTKVLMRPIAGPPFLVAPGAQRVGQVAPGHPASEGQSWERSGHLSHSGAQALSSLSWLFRVTGGARTTGASLGAI